MKFTIGQSVRYKPGFGTYGYEDALMPDGRVAGVVVGYSKTRIRVKLTLDLGRTVTRCVDPASLTPAHSMTGESKRDDEAGESCM